jgi:hypothetical protein
VRSSHWADAAMASALGASQHASFKLGSPARYITYSTVWYATSLYVSYSMVLYQGKNKYVLTLMVPTVAAGFLKFK